MAGRERTRRRTALVVRWVKSASFRMNPQKHGATRAIAQEKTPTQTSWGFGIGGAMWILVQVHTNGACYLGASSCVCSEQLQVTEKSV